MQPLQPNIIAGYNQGGLIRDKKPFLLPNQAFARLNNAYVWRDRVRKREGLQLLGRLRRTLSAQSQTDADGTDTYTIADLLTAQRATQPNAELQLESVVLTIDPGGANETEFTDDGLGGWTRTAGTAYDIVSPSTSADPSTINYVTGAIVLTWTGGGTPPNLTNVEAAYAYYPSLPVMGIWQQELAAINDERTVFWDTRYNYIYTGGDFQQLTADTWAGTDSDFFWATNYRGTQPYDRLFFATNFLQTDPMRYFDTVWNTFAPLVAAADTLYQARVLLPYYGRLIALNVWEGTTAGGAALANNFYNRCRFSQVGNPIQADAWQSDIFGKGGFIDAPTNEAILSAQLFKNTLIVSFERSTWQLRYVGEYGLPFIWERISSDFGSESTFSTILFDSGVLAVGDKAIISSDALTVNRIDEQIPDQVFEFHNLENGHKRIVGVRDFQKEVVYWCYSDGDLDRKFPNYSLLYNYKNNTYANFRNNVTFFGTFQAPTGVTWDSLTVFWDNDNVLWEDDPDELALFPSIVSGNQQGFIHYYAKSSFDEPSLTITDVTIPVDEEDSISLEIINHNLEAGEIIYLTGLEFIESGVPIATDLNERIFQVATRVDADNILINEWDGENYISNYDREPTNAAEYIGGGRVTLLPKMYIEMKDFNPYAAQGSQVKISYIDFLTDVPVEDSAISVAMSVNIYVNTSLAFQGNTLVSNRSGSTTLTAPYYVEGSDYVWHRFYATLTGQFLRIVMTYNDTLMNDINTHTYGWTLNAMTIYSRPGGKQIF